MIEFYNQLINSNDIIPDRIMASRLFCLNKDVSSPNNIDKIRPITIFKPLMKIC